MALVLLNPTDSIIQSLQYDIFLHDVDYNIENIDIKNN